MNNKYIITRDSDSPYLEHYGVAGMKWDPSKLFGKKKPDAMDAATTAGTSGRKVASSRMSNRIVDAGREGQLYGSTKTLEKIDAAIKQAEHEARVAQEEYKQQFDNPNPTKRKQAIAKNQAATRKLEKLQAIRKKYSK